jgi:transposase InsO family protein
MINSTKNLSVSKACKALEVSRSGYYKWKNREPIIIDDTALRKEIEGITLEFPGYGYRRVTRELNRRSIIINHKKVLRIMKEWNILCRRKKAFKPVTTQSDHDCKIYPNFARGLKVTGLNKLWVADITYIRLLHEFIYLAAVIDIFSRKCIGWCLGRNIDTQLTLNALNMAIKKRKPLDFLEVIHHSDRGVQYASQPYVDRLVELGIEISMSRSGNPYDNAFAESFMKTLKIEEVYIKEYETFEEAHKNIKHFIDLVYNKKRLHSSLGYVPPEEFEMEVLSKI